MNQNQSQLIHKRMKIIHHYHLFNMIYDQLIVFCFFLVLKYYYIEIHCHHHRCSSVVIKVIRVTPFFYLPIIHIYTHFSLSFVLSFFLFCCSLLLLYSTLLIIIMMIIMTEGHILYFLSWISLGLPYNPFMCTIKRPIYS